MGSQGHDKRSWCPGSGGLKKTNLLFNRTDRPNRDVAPMKSLHLE